MELYTEQQNTLQVSPQEASVLQWIVFDCKIRQIIYIKLLRLRPLSKSEQTYN